MAKKRHNPDQRKQWAAQWHASGLSGREFAKQHGLPVESICRWGREFPEAKAVERRETFTEIRLNGSTEETPSAIEVVLSNGRRIRVLGDVAATRLRAVVEALES